MRWPPGDTRFLCPSNLDGVRPGLALLLTSVLAATACPGLSDDSGPRGWRGTEINARFGQYDRLRIAAGPEGIVVATSGGKIHPRLWHSSDGESWQPITLPGLENFAFVGIFDIVWSGDRFVAAGDGTTGPEGTPPNSGPLALIYESPDGTSWRRTIDPDLAGFAIISAVEPTSRGLVAAGDVRKQPEVGPVRPSIWISAEAGEWQRVYADPRVDGAPAGIVEFGRKILAPGSVDQKAVIWASEDGREWRRQVLPGGYGSAWLAAVLPDRALVGGNSEEGHGMTVWSSADGSKWDIVAGVEDFGGSAPVPDWFVFDEGDVLDLVPFWGGVVARAQVGRRAQPEWCYVDVTTCYQTTLELLFSPDGATWRVMASGKRGLPRDPLALARWGDTLLVVGEEDRRLTLWVTDTLGKTYAIEPERKPQLPFELVKGGDRLRPGVTYGYPLYVHCGIYQLGVFNGRAWILGREPRDAPPSETWPRQWDFIYGTLRLTDSNRIEYSVPGGVIGIYRPVDKSRFGSCD
jgi:hypothetical protein